MFKRIVIGFFAILGAYYVSMSIAQNVPYLQTVWVSTEIWMKSGSVLDIDGSTEIAGTVITGSDLFSGTDVFTTTNAHDTVLISGAEATDIYVINAYGTGAVDQQDVLQADPRADTLIVHRLASGASALTYGWIRIEQ